ncbi:transcription factor WRKY45-1-like [Curcuma longa]|uniref:transcription factor WRKY45-1-like n=1 Tax=Curcuma longa TaxID=136217 RepID=UPI003D9E9EE8
MSCDEHLMVVEDLNRAQELTSQLQAVLLPLLPPGSPWSELARDHLREMIRCSTSALSVLQACASRFDTVAANGQRRSPEHEKVRNAKRRRNEDSQSIITTIPHEDGHKWRKYGEKLIRGSKHPRSYYRCVHDKEQGCLAKKTIQEEDIESYPPKYSVVYAMVHACGSTSTSLPNNNLVPLLDTSFDLEHVVTNEFSSKQKVMHPLPCEGKNETVLELPISPELDALFEAMMDTYLDEKK